jgi:hypothetical protein
MSLDGRRLLRPPIEDCPSRSAIISCSRIHAHPLGSNLEEELRNAFFISPFAEQSRNGTEITVVLVLGLWDVGHTDRVPSGHEHPSEASSALCLPPCVVVGEIHHRMVPAGDVSGGVGQCSRMSPEVLACYLLGVDDSWGSCFFCDK